MQDKTFHRCFVIKRFIVFHDTADTTVSAFETECNGQTKRFNIFRIMDIFQHDHHIAEGRAGNGMIEIKAMGQHFHGIVLMLDSGKNGLPGLQDQFFETLSLFHRGSQYQERIDEVLTGFLFIDGHTENNIGTAGIAVQ